MVTTMTAENSGAKAKKLPHGIVDQAIRYESTKKVTNS